MASIEHQFAVLSPNSVYFEIDSAYVGDRFGISVITPPDYESKPGRFPAIYVTDGNTNALLAAAVSFLLLGDHLRPMRSFVQVCIGFADVDLARRLINRNRDFIPPGEPLSPRIEQHIGSKPYARMLGPMGHRAFMEQARNGKADKFLQFLEKELHPEVTRRFRVSDGEAGLFGHSQGGLFTLYTLTSGSPLFTKFGAGSPGFFTEDSNIYSLYEKLVAKTGENGRDLQLHLIVNEHEMTGTIALYRLIGIGSFKFIDLIRTKPLPGLRLTTSVTPGENHFSGVFDAYRSFLRACYRRSSTE